MELARHHFVDRDLVGGHPALDFVNTVTGWIAWPVDWLDCCATLFEWAELSGTITQPERVMLGHLAEVDAALAEAALTRVKDLRQALYRIFEAVIAGEHPPEPSLQELESAWKQAAERMRLVPAERGIRPTLDVSGSALDLIRDRLAFAAIDLLADFPVGRARICRGCGWMFVDRSKAGRRIWCDMATCGNVAKSRRHYARRKSGALD